MYRNILIAVDGSESSKRALLQAVHMANAGYEKMTAVYVLDRSAMFMYAANYDQFAFVDTLRHDGERVLADAQAVMAEHGLKCDVEMAETDNIAEDVADCLLRCAQRSGADLVVMGTHGRRGVSRITTGSVAERFLRFSCCPVLLVREKVVAASDIKTARRAAQFIAAQARLPAIGRFQLHPQRAS